MKRRIGYYNAGMTDFSEAASKKRGRPPVIDKEWLPEMSRAHPHLKTERGLRNKDLAYHTIHHVLGLTPTNAVTPNDGLPERHRWLVDWEADVIRWSILTELGRLALEQGNEAAIDVADWICERKPSVKEGTAIVRRLRLCRLEKVQRPSREKLIDRLAAAIALYRAEYPDLSYTEMLEVLHAVYRAVRVIAQRQD